MPALSVETVRGRRRLKLSPALTVLLLFLLSGFITLFCLYLQPNAFRTVLGNLLRQPLLIPLNWFPALVLLAAAYFLMGNLFWAGAVSGGLLSLLSYINLLKIEGREDPLVPADLGLFREALNAAGEYQLYMHWDKVAMMAVLAALAVVLGIFIKSPRPRLPWRLGCAAAALLLLVGAVRFVYTNRTLYNSFSVPSPYNIPSVFNTLGFPYCFLYNYDLYPVDRPEGYSKAEVEGWNAPTDADDPAVEPNIIMVMCEAFSDLSGEEMFLYDPEDNPLAGFRQVAADEKAVSGRIVVTNYGAGTANTEFNVLTGMQTAMIGEGTTSAFRTVRKATHSIASFLGEKGYATFFMHPGQSWFYNRSSVYQRLGISDQIFSEAFDATDYKGTMISDAAFLDELKADLQTRLVEGEAPLFGYTVTIQNHLSYYYTKYDQPTDPVPVSLPLSEAAREYLSVYMEGVRDSSAMLVELTQYLEGLDEPTILVFFGDHRPNVGTACAELGLGYNENRTPEETVETYAVPYLIWCNSAYAGQVDLPARYDALSLPENGLISDNYLGAMVLELAGFAGHDPFFDEVNALRRALPVLREHAYCLPDGSFADAVSEDVQAMIDRLDKWTYYFLK